MNIIRRVINILSACAIAIITMYFVVSVCLTLFLLFGIIDQNFSVQGEFKIPSLRILFFFQICCVLAISLFVLVRGKIGKKYDFKFLRPK